MPDEPLDTETPAEPEEAKQPAESAIAVEIERENTRPAVSDEDLSKLTAGEDDEISRANDQAKRMVKGLRTAYQEQRRRAEQWSRDAATAGNLAEQLYRENQALKQSVNRSESALIVQAKTRASAELEHAKTRYKQALAAGDADLIVAANEDLAKAVAEQRHLQLLEPAAAPAGAEGNGNGSERAAPAEAAPPPAATAPPPSARTRAFVEQNPWFGKDQEMTNFAMRQHQHLALDGITEDSNPDLYWRTIEGKMKEAYPEKFPKAQPAEGRARPVAVTGATRSNGTASTPTADGKRIVRLTESQVRIAKRLGLTPEDYAAQVVKEEMESKRSVQ